MIRIDGETVGSGKIEQTEHILEDIRQARGFLDGAVNDGLFLHKDHTRFDLVEIYDSRDAWDGLLTRRFVGRIVVDDELLSEAFRMMDERRCSIVIGTVFRALTVERV